jgi:urease accessory protein
MDNLALLNLLNLVSPALPIGSYSYSQGLESAIEKGWVSNEAELEEWLHGILEYSLCRLDVPSLLQCHRAWHDGDRQQFALWNQRILASRESRELLLEDTQTGAALIKLLRQIYPTDSNGGDDFPAGDISLPAAFAVAGNLWQIPAAETALALLWSWAENQVAAGIKLIPIGQTSGQRVLHHMKQRIPRCFDAALTLPQQQIGSGLPGLALASAAHETQYCRLFRS